MSEVDEARQRVRGIDQEIRDHLSYLPILRDKLMNALERAQNSPGTNWKPFLDNLLDDDIRNAQGYYTRLITERRRLVDILRSTPSGDIALIRAQADQETIYRSKMRTIEYELVKPILAYRQPKPYGQILDEKIGDNTWSSSTVSPDTEPGGSIDVSGNLICIICTENLLESDVLCRVNCQRRHVFHRDCAIRWFNVDVGDHGPNYWCPMCQRPVKRPGELEQDFQERREALKVTQIAPVVLAPTLKLVESTDKESTAFGSTNRNKAVNLKNINEVIKYLSSL
jgi:hypothetical protein